MKSLAFLFGILFFLPFALNAQELKGEVDSFRSISPSEIESQWLNDSLETSLYPVKESDSSQNTLINKLENNKKAASEIIDSLRNNAKAEIDSLKAVDLPHKKYAQKLDSLNSFNAQKVNKKISGIEEGGKEKINQAQNSISEKLEGKNATSEISIQKSKLSDKLETQDTGLEVLKEKLPSNEEADFLNDQESNLFLDTGDNNDISLSTDFELDRSLELKGKVSEHKTEAQKTVDLHKEKLTEVKEKDEISKLTNVVGEVEENGAELSEYQRELEEVKSGNLKGVEKRAEEEAVKNIEQIGELQTQSEDLTEDIGDIDQHRDEAFVKQQMKEKAFELAAEKFAPNSEKLKLAQSKLSKYKKKYAGVKRFKNNLIKNNSLAERLILGINLEMVRIKTASLDFTPALGYRLTDRFTSYFAYNYRFTLNTSHRSLDWGNPTYGARGTLTYAITNASSLIFSFEQIRTNVPRAFVTSEALRQWVNGGFIGVGKSYGITKKIKGSIQLIYNFLHNAKSPYSEKYNIRMGFDLKMFRKIEKEDMQVSKGLNH